MQGMISGRLDFQMTAHAALRQARAARVAITAAGCVCKRQASRCIGDPQNRRHTCRSLASSTWAYSPNRPPLASPAVPCSLGEHSDSPVHTPGQVGQCIRITVGSPRPSCSQEALTLRDPGLPAFAEQRDINHHALRQQAATGGPSCHGQGLQDRRGNRAAPSNPSVGVRVKQFVRAGVHARAWWAARGGARPATCAGRGLAAAGGGAAGGGAEGGAAGTAGGGLQAAPLLLGEPPGLAAQVPLPLRPLVRLVLLHRRRIGCCVMAVCGHVLLGSGDKPELLKHICSREVAANHCEIPPSRPATLRVSLLPTNTPPPN
jgi:hypothetical protein